MSEFTGKLIVKTETKEYGSKGFKKRTFVVESEDKYPQKIEFELVKDKMISVSRRHTPRELWPNWMK